MAIESLCFEPIPRQYFYVQNSLQLEHTIAWTTPPEDAWKLNFAACLGSEWSYTGAGFVLRDHHGLFKVAQATPLLTHFSLFEANLVAIEKGLHEALVQGIDYLEVEGHSTSTLEVVFNAAVMPYSASAVIRRCRKLVNEFKVIKYHPVPEYANRASMRIAEVAANVIEVKQWTKESPPEIANILVEDMIGHRQVYYMRS